VNDYVMSVLLGIVEGLTEFLPVSSTAHLRISEALMHISLTDPYWKMYTIVIQLGAILALLLLFFPRIVSLFRSFPRGEDNQHTFWNNPVTLTAVAFVVTSIPSLLLVKVIGKHLESLTIIAWSFVIGGVIMWVVDVASDRRDNDTKEVEQMTIGQAIWVGFCQIFSAVFPGTSRSMSTITGGQMVGMTRPAALEFSFLLSIPIMIAATGYDLLRTLHPKHLAGAEAISPLVMTGHEWVVLAIGFVVSFIVALGVVEWFLRWVRHHGFVPFAIYRILAGVVLFAWIHHWIG
jgi:undecaprenyl-diphosphatase